jgi:NitT/TauT family transport system permease protein
LIGAIAAELTAGTQGGQAGLAVRIVEAGYRLNIPRMFAALALVAMTGIAIYVALAALSRWVLRHWDERASDAA